jgi:hypothetical protein
LATTSELSAINRHPYVFGASVKGQLHIQNTLPCQDACAYLVLPSGVVIIGVADGLGSASVSDIGARVAVQASVEAAASLLDPTSAPVVSLEETVRTAAARGRRSLEECALAQPCKLRELACTLIVAAANNDSLSVAHIGDGAVVGEMDGALRLISAPGDSEFTNEVVPITSIDWEEHLRIVSMCSGVSSIAVFTDGCQRAAFRKSEAGLEPFEKFFGPIFDYARDLPDPTQGVTEIEGLLGSRKICENSDDDKTLVIGVLKAS